MKGKEDAISIFTVLGNTEWVLHNTNWFALDQQHDKFLQLYRGQAWVMAEKFGNDLRTAWPEMSDYYDVMLERIETYKNESPGEDWDGVYRATTK